MNYTRPRLKLERAKLLIDLERLYYDNHYKADLGYIICQLSEIDQLLKEHTNK